MKKILAGVLVITSILVLLCSCSSDKQVDKVMDMYNSSVPTGIVAETTQTFGDRVLRGSYSLKKGTVDGKNAMVYEERHQEIYSVEEGSGSVVTPPIQEVSLVKEYIEGRGVRTDRKGKWASSETLEIDSIALNLDKKLIDEVAYKNNTLSFIVYASDTEAVFGKDIGADVSVSIKDDGAYVIGVELFWLIPANEAEQTVLTAANVKITYTYDIITDLGIA